MAYNFRKSPAIVAAVQKSECEALIVIEILHSVIFCRFLFLLEVLIESNDYHLNLLVFLVFKLAVVKIENRQASV